MRAIFFALLACGISSIAAADATHIGFKAAVEKGLIKVAATTTGKSYHSKALRLRINNATKHSLQISLDPALIFKPENPAYQPLILPAEEQLALAPDGTAEIDVQTFCGKLLAEAPDANLTYKFWKQGDSTMIKVTQFIRKHDLYDQLGQSAIWALTDRQNLGAVVDPDRPQASAGLQMLMKTLTGWPMPEYFKVYKLDTVAGQLVFQKRILKIIANMEWKLDAPAAVTLGIYNQAGDLVQGVFDQKQMAKGGYKMQVQFEAEGAPPGTYFMRLLEGEKMRKEIKVAVD